jgi:hypothetical protein
MGVDERAQVPLGARQLFGEVGFTCRLPFLAAKGYGVGVDVCDVDAVRSSVPPLVDASASA